jgi:hypothetical protein
LNNACSAHPSSFARPDSQGRLSLHAARLGRASRAKLSPWRLFALFPGLSTLESLVRLRVSF